MKPTTMMTRPGMLRRVLVLVAAVAALLLTLAAMTLSRGSAGEQDRKGLIKFSHKLHAKDQGIGCADCHDAAASSKVSSDNLLAKKAACQSCHEDQLKSDCTFCHTSDNKDSYVAFESPKRELIFAHETHVGANKMECLTCHAGVDEAEAPSSGKLPAMTVCNTCHNASKAQNFCESCHTDLVSLRPKEHNNRDFLAEHKRIARLDNASCMTCHTEVSCQDCHNGGSLTKTMKSGDYVSSHAPRNLSLNRGQGQGVSKVHDLNFRYTHGIQAAGRTASCQTCHAQQEFCTTCHQAGGDINQGTFKPKSHDEPGFKTIGRGTGGGVHAKLARRDIESCAACHDAQGADPTCIRCHNDPDGVRGNNPKTHPGGYMRDSEDGNWHTDPGASCYACHTDSNARPGGVRGVKFCGYCHH